MTDIISNKKMMLEDVLSVDSDIDRLLSMVDYLVENSNIVGYNDKGKPYFSTPIRFKESSCLTLREFCEGYLKTDNVYETLMSIRDLAHIKRNDSGLVDVGYVYGKSGMPKIYRVNKKWTYRVYGRYISEVSKQDAGIELHLLDDDQDFILVKVLSKNKVKIKGAFLFRSELDKLRTLLLRITKDDSVVDSFLDEYRKYLKTGVFRDIKVK